MLQRQQLSPHPLVVYGKIGYKNEKVVFPPSHFFFISKGSLFMKTSKDKKKPSQISLPLTLKSTKPSKRIKPSSIPPLRKKGSRRYYHLVQFLSPSLLVDNSRLFSDSVNNHNWSYQIFNITPWRTREVLEFLSDNRYPNPNPREVSHICNQLRAMKYLPTGYDKCSAPRPFLLHLVDHLCVEGFEEGLMKNNPCHIKVYKPLNSSQKFSLKNPVAIHEELKNTHVFLSCKHFFQFFSITPEEFQELQEYASAICLNGMYLYKFKRYNQTYFFSIIQPDLSVYLNTHNRRFKENILI